MDGVPAFELSIFLPATFAAALVAGLAGFAFGLIAAATWLHVLSPSDTAALIVGFGLVVPGVAVWKLRRALDPRRFDLLSSTGKDQSGLAREEPQQPRHMLFSFLSSAWSSSFCFFSAAVS